MGLVSPENNIEYTDFHRAREFARSARLSDKAEWRTFLVEENELIGKSPLELIIPEERQKLKDYLELRLEGITTRDSYDTQIQKSDGKVIDISLDVAGIRDESDQVINGDNFVSTQVDDLEAKWLERLDGAACDVIQICKTA